MLYQTMSSVKLQTFFRFVRRPFVAAMLLVALNPLVPAVWAHETGTPHFHAVPNWLTAFLEALYGHLATGLASLVQVVTYMF